MFGGGITPYLMEHRNKFEGSEDPASFFSSYERSLISLAVVVVIIVIVCKYGCSCTCWLLVSFCIAVVVVVVVVVVVDNVRY